MKRKSLETLIVFAIILIYLTFFSTSCSKDNIIDKPVADDIITYEQKNANIELLGEVFAKLFSQNKELRELVWREIQKKVTHDYDIPIIFIKDEIIGGETVGELAANCLKTIAPEANFNSILNSLHYVQFTIPLHQVRSWDTSVLPTVVVVPVDKSHKEVVSFVSYRPNGERIALSSREEPIEQVIVIRESDRIDNMGNLSVNKYGLMIPERDRVGINEVKILNDNLIKSGEISKIEEEPFLVVISEDEMNERIAQFKSEQESLKLKREKELKIFMETFENSTKNIVLNNLISFSNQPNAICLTWSAVEGANYYRVYAAGNFNVNGQKQFVSRQEIGSVNSLNLTYQFPYAIEMYNIWVEGHSNLLRDPISCSNYVSTMTSGRANGCIEYPSRIYMTRSAMIDLEGYYANELELYWCISMVNTNGNPSLITMGGITFYPYYFLQIMQTTIINPSANTLPLFQWNRFTYGLNSSNNGAYSVYWYEDDYNRTDKTKQIATKAAIFVAGTTLLGSPILTETVLNIGNIAFDLDDRDDEIGFCDITWWTPQGFRTFPMAGVQIDFSYQNP